MPKTIANAVGAAVGLAVDNLRVPVWNRSGTRVEADLVQFDLTCSDAAVSNYRPGDSASALANVIACVAADRDISIYAVCDTPIHSFATSADDGRMFVYMWGQDIYGNVDNTDAADDATGGDVVYGPEVGLLDHLEFPEDSVATLNAGTRRLALIKNGETATHATQTKVKLGFFDGWGSLLGWHHLGTRGT
jgi:hypothetical protein